MLFPPVVIDFPNSKVCLTGKCPTGHSRVVIDLTWGGGSVLCSQSLVKALVHKRFRSHCLCTRGGGEGGKSIYYEGHVLFVLKSESTVDKRTRSINRYDIP